MEAKKVIIGPIKKRIRVRIPANILKEGLAGKVVKKGNVVSLTPETLLFIDVFKKLKKSQKKFDREFAKPFDNINKFIVEETVPKQKVKITKSTKILINNKITSKEQLINITRFMEKRKAKNHSR